MNHRGTLLRLFAVLMAMGLVAAACGSDSTDTESSTEGETEAETAEEAEGEEEQGGSIDEDAADEAVADAADQAEADGPAASTATNIDELEAEWAAARQVVVDELTAGIESGEYGLGDDNFLRGPSGFEIDMSQCPSDWTDNEGIGETIKIGHPGPQSGQLAVYGNMGIGWEVYLDYVNEKHGGVAGVPLELLRRDDQYVATVTIELVDELLQSDKPFAFHTLGSPSTLAVYDTLNDKCIPQLFSATGHPAWGDPVEHPWTTGSILGYFTEATLWGAWIKENMADQLPVTVSGLIIDNDFGVAYEQGMINYVENNPDVVSDFQIVKHDATAATVTNEMTTIAANEPDVFIAMTAGNACLLAVEEAGRSGLVDSDSILFMPSVCKDPNSFMIPAGETADGWNIVGGGAKVNTDPQYADDPYITWANETLAAADLDISIGLYFTGFGFYAWPMVEALRVAADLPGGLTRTNAILATRSLRLNHPALIDGVEFAVDGAADAYFVEGSDFSVYDAANESWTQVGGIVDLNGSSPNCTWTDEGCT